jgi:predicted RNA-binding protein YlxR (DUF448 family)
LPRVKRVPQRTCVGCGEVEGKRELVRFVRTPEGAVVCDPSGKRNGRGAYVHAEAACLEQALAGRLAHALRCAVTAEDAAALRQSFAELLAARQAKRPPMVHRAPEPLRLQPRPRRTSGRRAARP